MKTIFFNRFLILSFLSITIFTLSVRCTSHLNDINSKAYTHLKEKDPDMIFLKNLEYILSDSGGKFFRDSINKVYNDSISQLPIVTAAGHCTRIDLGGYPVRFSEADSCIKKYFEEMKGAPITWNETSPRKITYYENFGGQDFFRWLKDDLNLKEPKRNLFILAKLGMYTPEYVKSHKLDLCDIGRIAIFLYPTLSNGNPLETSAGVKVNVYNLGGLYP